MIIGIGVDIIEMDRVQRAIASEAFLKRVYTGNEIEYCKARGKSRVQSFAGRFAAKEAILKALGTGLRGGELVDIDIFNDELGCPRVRLSGYFAEYAEKKGVKNIWLSISHSKTSAVSQCVLEG